LKETIMSHSNVANPHDENPAFQGGLEAMMKPRIKYENITMEPVVFHEREPDVTAGVRHAGFYVAVRVENWGRMDLLSRVAENVQEMRQRHPDLTLAHWAIPATFGKTYDDLEEFLGIKGTHGMGPVRNLSITGCTLVAKAHKNADPANTPSVTHRWDKAVPLKPVVDGNYRNVEAELYLTEADQTAKEPIVKVQVNTEQGSLHWRAAFPDHPTRLINQAILELGFYLEDRRA
jgi:hypothetical protein